MRKKKNKTIIPVTVLVIIAITAMTVLGFRYLNKSRLPANSLNTEQKNDGIAKQDQASIESDKGSTDNLDVTANPTTKQAIPIPATPQFTKSSGNNGPVPVGVSINFVCTAEPGVDCSILLVSGSKQTSVGPTKVTDNGRGQYFASLYWTSVKGSYKVTAQAKNIQGGASSSIAQALEVQ